ncbi:MAG: carbohydrate ABC transporter permease [Clostridia bacterium]|nr:carbohydrate ABC transporter permease [Clostridia bacterium]
MDFGKARSKSEMMKNKKLGRFTWFDGLNTVLMVFLCMIMLYPMLYIIGRSFMNPIEKAEHVLRVIPRKPVLEAYNYIFTRSSFIVSGMKSSVIITVLGTALNMLATAPMAYVLSKREYPMRNLITALVVFTMWFGGGMIPNYILVKSLGLIDTYWALWLPGLISSWNMLVLRNFFQMIPKELEESAKIDGANEIRIFVRIILPLSTASIASISLFYAVGHWNSWFNSMIYINSNYKLPLQNHLRRVLNSISALNSDGAAMGNDALTIARIPTADILQYACIVVTVLPIIVVYPFLQKYFVKGVMAGSLKG